VLAVLVLPLLHFAALPATAEGAQAGVAGVASPPSKGGSGLSTGGSSTAFQLKLPSGSACTADSAHGSYRVQSYMVPGTDDPATLTFRSQGPVGAGRRPLYDIQTSAYANAQTANAEPEGGPGLIVNVPLFSFAVFTPRDVTPGSYNLGIACTHNGQVDRFWNARMTMSRNDSDQPAGLTWKVEGGAEAPSSTGSRRLVVAAGAALAGAAGILLFRRRGRAQSGPAPRPTAKESR